MLLPGLFLRESLMKDSMYDLLAIGAHPDDVEVGAGGVLIDLATRGYRCGVAILTRGEMGTGGDPQTRSREITAAAAIMGVDVVAIFDWGDTKLTDSIEHRLELASVIRKCRPKVILAPYPRVGHGRRQSHPDHVASGIITINAANLSALKKADLPGEPYRTNRVFHYFLPPDVTPDFVVDITPHFDRWMEALTAHESQFLNPEKSKNYVEHLTAISRSFGLQAGCQYGQGFAAVGPVLIDNMMKLVEDSES